MDDHPQQIEINEQKYAIMGPIGEGATGIVYFAEDRKKNKFAIKMVRNYSKYKIKEAIDQEIKIQQQFRKSKNVIQCYGFTVIGTRIYILFQLGQSSLRNIIDISPLTKKQYFNMLSDISKALMEVHQKGITHRDIKPENIIITGDGSYKLTDFGISIAQTISQQTIGTPLYYSPEAIFQSEKQLNQKVDVWGLGLVAFESFFGIHPFYYHGSTEKTISQAFQILKQNISQLTPQFTLKKFKAHIKSKNMYSILKFVQQKEQSAAPILMELFESFFQRVPEKRPQITYIAAVIESLREVVDSIKIKKVRVIAQHTPWDIQFFINTLNMFYELNFQLPSKNQSQIQYGFEASIWFICAANYGGHKMVNFYQNDLIQKKAPQHKTMWKEIKTILIPYYYQLKSDAYSFYPRVRELAYKVLICSIWNKLLFNNKKLMTYVSKLKGFQMETLQCLTNHELFVDSQITKIEEFVLNQFSD